MSTNEALERFLHENGNDLKAMGMLLCRLIQADLLVMSVEPSPVLFFIMSMSQNGQLGTKKLVGELVQELSGTGLPLLTDGHGGSILRL